MTDVTRKKLEDEVNRLSDQSKKVDVSPDDVNDAFDTLIKALRIGSIFGGLITFGAGNLTAEYAESKRTEIISGINTLRGKLAEALDGAAAPLKFIDDAAEWQKVKASIVEAGNDAGKQTLNGYWEGFAFERYTSSATAQTTAAESVAGLCDSIIEHLETMAKAGLDFYVSVTKAVTTYVAAAAAAIAKIATVVEAPWGISDTIDLVAGIVQTFVDLADASVKLIQDQMISAEKLSGNTLAQKGIPGNNWPAATSDEFDDKDSWDVPA